MDFTLMELRLLQTSIETEIIRREEKKSMSEEDKQKVAILEDLAERISNEKLAAFRRMKEKGVI